MDPRSPLFTFLCVYRHGSQLKAAEQLHLTQPAISQQIKFLEQRFDRPLFKREGRQSVPTAFAHQLALQISKPLDSLEEIWDSLKLKSSPIKKVYIGGLGEFISVVFAPHLHELTEQGIHCRFTYGYLHLEKQLLQNELDIVQFCAHVAHPGIEVEKFFTEEFVLIGHPKWLTHFPPGLSAAKLLAALQNTPWVAYDESLLFIKEYFMTAFSQPFDGKIALTMPDLWSMLQATIGGAGITILPSYFCQDAIKAKKIAVLYKPKKGPKLDFYLGWKDGALANPHIKTTKLFLQRVAKLMQC